ncbi:LPXTG cell wall anchor domain-containing protein [Bifidobacterium reuteri]|uniref:LPXTG cell wall anchor domain-containing protein n=1 Tax=Bifidobacterium reuteri TaxID=983706 RepID=UPI0009E09E60|nr:LPXTG cell wall anchor domain-containing protein [Bifidobacterium reuteri]
MTFTCAIPAAYGQTSAGSAVSGSSSGVTVISNGAVVTDSTIVSAAETLRRTSGDGNDTATAQTSSSQTSAIGQFPSDTHSAFTTRTILDAGDESADTQSADDTEADNAQTGNADNAGNAASDDAVGSSGATEPARAVADTLGGRDYAGQVTKEIGGKTYILIGNEQQLRAIGSGKKVVGGTVYQVPQKVVNTGSVLLPNLEWQDAGDESVAYAGDADLADNDTLRDENFDDHDAVSASSSSTRTKYFVKDADGNRLDVTDGTYGPNTGLSYASDGNYIIFRDIDLSRNAADQNNTDWSPLMFSGTMLGAVAADAATAGTLFDVIDADGPGVKNNPAKPVIAHVVVNQPEGNLDVDKQQGIGFFASITSTSSITNNGNNKGGVQSLGTVTVANLKLDDVTVSNNATVAHVDETLVSALLKLVGLLLKPLGLGLDELLTVHKNNPSNFATGAFAGRIYGDVKVTGCEVTDATVANGKGMTGGFAGYVEGATRYDIASESLGTLITVLTDILNVIPFLGLGDLVDWLLGSTLGLNALVPVGYYNPEISDSHVVNFKQNTVIGNDDSDYAGGFVGAQVGAIIEQSSVTSENAFSVKAGKYAGGFVGVSRNGEVGGLLGSLGITILSALRPQSLIEESSLSVTGDRGQVEITAANYAGGFAGRLANAYAINDSLSAAVNVIATASHAGGFTGRASAGWGLEAGTDSDEKLSDTSLVKNLTTILTKLLGTNPDGAGALLTIAGVNPSVVLGAQMDGDITVTSQGDYAGGLIGDGSGTIIADSTQERIADLSFWKYDSSRAIPQQRSTVVKGLRSSQADGSYAGGIAGNLQPTTVAGLLNSVVKIGDLTMLQKFDQFAPFTVDNVTMQGIQDGWSVKAGGYRAGGAIGCATGGDITNTNLSALTSVEARGEAGGFIGFSGPGDTVGANSLNLLGLVKLSGLLSVAEYSSVEVAQSNVTGIASGFTVQATGSNANGETNTYASGGFYGQANSTKTRESHVANLKSVIADSTMSDGMAGGFVGYSTTGGLAEAVSDSDDSEALKNPLTGSLISIDDLLGAVPYLIPDYKDTTVSYVNGGYVEADTAGGFAGDLQSGKVNQFSSKELEDTAMQAIQTRVAADDYAAVINLDHVAGGAYAGGFGGKVVSGALASAGKGGISLLGKLGTVQLSNLVDLVQGYVPYISYASVKSDATTVAADASGNAISDPKTPGLVVSADRLDQTDAQSGSAGGFIGYGSGVQVSHSNVTQLRYTKVTEPKALEGADGSSYFDTAKSAYAIDGKRYAGGYIGKMDIGSAASVGNGLSLLGQNLTLDGVASVLSVVVSTIEHSDVTGDAAGYSVIASDTSEQNTVVGDGTATPGSADNPLGEAGGFAGRVMGGHIQDSNSHNFAYIIGQITAGGYAGGIAPGDAADILGEHSSILSGLVDTDEALASVLQDFVPTIRNSSTDAVPCGAAIRAQAVSEAGIRRGMAGGYVGHNEGGHIWGNNSSSWKSENDDNGYSGPKHKAYAARIRSVYGAELAGGFTGFMESADTAETGNLSLLFGLIKVNNLLGALKMAYPTEEHSEVTGPLRNLDLATWQAWVKAVGINGAYGKEFAELIKNSGTITSTDQLDGYIYGFNVVAGRSEYSNDADLLDSGAAGGHVGLMRTGTITDGQSLDVKTVSAMRAAGGYAGTMESGTAAQFGSVQLLGEKGLNLSLAQLLGVAEVFVPVAKSSSVNGYRKGMKVEATGTDITHGTGNAGGYVGLAVGAQIWGDRDANGNTLADGAEASAAAGANVTNLRKVSGRNNVGGYVGIATSGSVADVNTNASSGFLQGVIDQLIQDVNPGGLINVLQATVVTIRGAHVSADSSDWGYTVESAYTDEQGDVQYAINAGGFAGSLQAAILGDKDSAKGTGTAADVSKDPAAVTVSDLRAVEGGQYAGGFFGLADVSSVASVGGNTAGTGDDTNLVLKLLKVGNIGVLEAFRVFIYDGRVAGVPDGIQVNAHTAQTYGMLDSTRFTGAAGGFGGGLINGSVKKSTVTNLNSVTGLNYTGGFIGHLGKSGTVSADKVTAADSVLAGLTAGVMDIWGSHVEDSSVAGISAGFTVTATHNGEDYGRDESLTDATHRKGEEIAAGFTGYADLSRISGSSVTNFKKASSGELAGGFAGQTTKAYLVDAKANSALVNLLVKWIINPLLKLLYVEKIENIGNNLSHYKDQLFGPLTKFIDLELFTDGNALYVNLLGLKIGVALDKTGTDTEDTAYIFIGDSKISVGCSKDGVDPDSVSNINAQLIKANRTKIATSSVQGIADGYDVFGGDATQGSDGTGATGYAGGFVAVNDEGLLEDNDMTYADTIRGASGLVGPFSGRTNLESVYDFNTVHGIEGNGNTYHIYRDVPETWSYALTAERKQFTYGSHMDNATKADGTASGTAGVLTLNLNRYDVAHLAENTVIKQFSDYTDAVMANNVGGSNTGTSSTGVKNEAAPLGVYVSDAKAVLMLDAAVEDNNGGFTPEPDDGQDPCGKDGCQTVDLTLQKVWKDYGRVARPDAIALKITATYTNDAGEKVTPDSIQCFDGDCNAVEQPNGWTVVLDSSDGALWSSTWRKKITGLPVAFKDDAGNLHYYTYTVSETWMMFGTGDITQCTTSVGADAKEGCKTPADAGYSVSVSYAADPNNTTGEGNKEYVATVTNSVPLPETGGQGTAWFVLFGLLLLGLGTAWYLRANSSGTTTPPRRRGRHATA